VLALDPRRRSAADSIPFDERAGACLMPCPGGVVVTDIDSVAIVPDGVGFAIETKTRTYDQRQLGRVLEQARWLGRRRRRWCRCGALPVLCVVHAAGVERSERGVVVVSIDRLGPVLWEVANRTGRGQSLQLGRGRVTEARRSLSVRSVRGLDSANTQTREDPGTIIMI
jgi:hypothetical protein